MSARHPSLSRDTSLRSAASLVFAMLIALLCAPCAAQRFEVHEGDFRIASFRFESGETLPELRIHYRTLGAVQRDGRGHATNAVLILHGTGGAGTQFIGS